MNARRALAFAALIALMIVWGSTFVVTRSAATQIPPLTLGALRFLIAAAVLVPLALARGGLRRLPKPVPWGALSIMAFTGVALYTIGFNYALSLASATQGAIVFALGPAAIAIGAVLFLGERLGRRRVTGIALSILGVGIVVAVGAGAGGGGSHPVLGALAMFGAILAWAAYTIIAKRLADADPVILTAVVTALGALMLTPLALIELTQLPWPTPDAGAWTGLLFLAVIASALAYLVYSYVLRELDASVVGAWSNLDPIVGVFSAVLLGEALHAGHVVGGLIAFAGMFLASWEAKPASSPR